MFYLLSLLIFIPSPIVFPINAEAWAITVGLLGDRPWLLVGFTLAASQTIGFVLLYVFGARVINMSSRLGAQVEKLDLKRFRGQAPAWIAVGGFLGVPPCVALSIAAPMAGISLRMHVAIVLTMRTIRFSLLAGVPTFFSQYFDPSLVPDWLKALL